MQKSHFLQQIAFLGKTQTSAKMQAMAACKMD